MKLLNRFLTLSLILSLFLALKANDVYAHCHQLTDPAGDSGSNFAFADVVAAVLSNEGDSIGVRITTNGNIPNGFGTTGVMIFGITFPASLLSGDSNDDGINIVTVHWKEDGSGWEGSQFIYRGELKSIPWNANIIIDGKTASFKIPKSLIGYGTLAYQINLGFLSSEGDTNDAMPSEKGFSDCYVAIPQQSAASPQSGGIVESKPSPQTEANAPIREGYKIVEKPGVVRASKHDVGGSFVLPSPSSPTKAKEENLEEPENIEQPSLLSDLAVIGTVGLGVIAVAYFLLRGRAGVGKKEVGGDSLPKLLYWRYFRQLGRKILPAVGFPGAGGGAGGGGGQCRDGDIRNIHPFKCRFLFLDPNGEIKIETDKWFEGPALQAKKMASWLAHVDVGTKGQTNDLRFQPWFLKVKETPQMLATDRNRHTRNKELARQFRVVYVEIPVQWRIDDCVIWEVCINGAWHKRKHFRLTYVPQKMKIDAKRDTQYKLHGVTFDDFPKWLEEFLKQFPNSKEPCDC